MSPWLWNLGGRHTPAAFGRSSHVGLRSSGVWWRHSAALETPTGTFRKSEKSKAQFFQFVFLAFSEQRKTWRVRLVLPWKGSTQLDQMLLSRGKPSRRQRNAVTITEETEVRFIRKRAWTTKGQFCFPCWGMQAMQSPSLPLPSGACCILCDSHSLRTKPGQDHRLAKKHLPETPFEAGHRAVTAFRRDETRVLHTFAHRSDTRILCGSVDSWNPTTAAKHCAFYRKAFHRNTMGSNYYTISVTFLKSSWLHTCQPTAERYQASLHNCINKIHVLSQEELSP